MQMVLSVGRGGCITVDGGDKVGITMRLRQAKGVIGVS